jgi:hypothetical protein
VQDLGYLSIYNEFRIHVLYTKDDKPVGEHEDTHLLTLPWGISVNFLQEGLAEYMVGHDWYGGSHIEGIRVGLEKEYILSPAILLTSEDWENTPQDGAMYYYCLAGAWVSYLISTYGLDQFKKLYTECSRQETSETMRKKYKENFGKNVGDLEREFFHKIEVFI